MNLHVDKVGVFSVKVFTAVYLLLLLLGLGAALGCVSKPYVVCGETRCTKPLTHEETVRAQEVKKVWGTDAPLHVEVAPR